MHVRRICNIAVENPDCTLDDRIMRRRRPSRGKPVATGHEFLRTQASLLSLLQQARSLWEVCDTSSDS